MSLSTSTPKPGKDKKQKTNHFSLHEPPALPSKRPVPADNPPHASSHPPKKKRKQFHPRAPQPSTSQHKPPGSAQTTNTNIKKEHSTEPPASPQNQPPANASHSQGKTHNPYRPRQPPWKHPHHHHAASKHKPATPAPAEAKTKTKKKRKRCRGTKGLVRLEARKAQREAAEEMRMFEGVWEESERRGKLAAAAAAAGAEGSGDQVVVKVEVHE